MPATRRLSVTIPHRHQQPNRRVRATILFIEQLGKALFGNALGDLIQEDVVPGVRIVELLLVTLAQKLFDVAEQIDLAAVRTGSEHRAGARLETRRLRAILPVRALGPHRPGDFSEGTHCSDRKPQKRPFCPPKGGGGLLGNTCSTLYEHLFKPRLSARR